MLFGQELIRSKMTERSICSDQNRVVLLQSMMSVSISMTPAKEHVSKDAYLQREQPLVISDHVPPPTCILSDSAMLLNTVT
jgi:hypothetical protein